MVVCQLRDICIDLVLCFAQSVWVSCLACDHFDSKCPLNCKFQMRFPIDTSSVVPSKCLYFVGGGFSFKLPSILPIKSVAFDVHFALSHQFQSNSANFDNFAHFSQNDKSIIEISRQFAASSEMFSTTSCDQTAWLLRIFSPSFWLASVLRSLSVYLVYDVSVCSI